MHSLVMKMIESKECRRWLVEIKFRSLPQSLFFDPVLHIHRSLISANSSDDDGDGDEVRMMTWMDDDKRRWRIRNRWHENGTTKTCKHNCRIKSACPELEHTTHSQKLAMHPAIRLTLALNLETCNSNNIMPDDSASFRVSGRTHVDEIRSGFVCKNPEGYDQDERFLQFTDILKNHE